MAEYVDFHYMPLEGKITGKQVLKQTEDAINDLGRHVYEIDIDNELIQEAIDTSDQAIDTAEAALSAVTTNRAMWFNTVAEMKATDIALGITAATRGKGVFNDGDGAFYAVREIKGGDVDSDDTVFLDNGNVAERIKQFNLVAKGNNIVYVDNVASLRTSDAVVGLVYGTKGYYTDNDCGDGLYVIRTAQQTDVDNGGSIIILDNGNVAELIIGDTVNVHQFGAKGNANYHNYADGNDYESVNVSSATVAPYWDNVNAQNNANVELQKWYVGATFETEGTYLNPANGKHYVNYDSDTDTYTTEAPYHDNVADKWYVTATYSNLANARVNGTWYYNAVFSTQAQDDTAFIQKAINTHVPIELFSGHTYLVVSLTLYHGFEINGNGGEIKRPNLKNAPYNYTDAQVKSSRMMDVTPATTGKNVNKKTIEFRNITFNANAYSMWNPLTDNLYKYEQGVIFYISGGYSLYHFRFRFDNVNFINNYTSNIAIQNYVDITITDSTVYNCFKGICTVVGGGNKIIVDSISVDSDYNNFTSFWYEPNSATVSAESSVNISNSLLLGDVQLITSYRGTVNLSNCKYECRGADGHIVPGLYSTVSMDNVFFFGKAESQIKIRGYGVFVATNCVFDGLGCVFFKYSSGADFYTRGLLNNCVFRNMKDGVVSDSTANQFDIELNQCLFENISGHALGSLTGQGVTSFKRFVVKNCIFDTDGYLWYAEQNTAQKTVVFGGGNDVVNTSNKGIHIYGGNQIFMKDEYWSVPVKIDTYRSGTSYNPVGFGYRMTYVTEAPTFRGINNIDHAQLTVSPYTKYTYTGNAWVADT